MIPPTVATIGNSAFDNTKLTRLDLSKATSLVEMCMWYGVFRGNGS